MTNAQSICFLVAALNLPDLSDDRDRSLPYNHLRIEPEWTVDVVFNFSRDALVPFLKEKPRHDEPCPRLCVEFDSLGELRVMQKHPVLTGDFPVRASLQVLATDLHGYIPSQHLESAFSNTMLLARTNLFKALPDAYANREHPTVEIALRKGGTSVRLAFRDAKSAKELPPEMASVLGTLWQYLPAEFDKLFRSYEVAKTSPLPVPAVQQFRKCGQHGTWMQPVRVPVERGTLSLKRAPPEAPNANFRVLISHMASGPDRLVLYCEDCRKAALR